MFSNVVQHNQCLASSAGTVYCTSQLHSFCTQMWKNLSILDIERAPGRFVLYHVRWLRYFPLRTGAHTGHVPIAGVSSFKKSWFYSMCTGSPSWQLSFAFRQVERYLIADHDDWGNFIILYMGMNIVFLKMLIAGMNVIKELRYLS